jgi:hypothetical protein
VELAETNPILGPRTRHRPMSDAPLSYDQRRKVFASIVGARAAGARPRPRDYRRHVAKRFRLTAERLAAIETEGDEQGWAPKPFRLEDEPG